MRNKHLSFTRQAIQIALLFLFHVLSISAFAQSKKIEGVVTDSRGNPLEGASVTVKGTTTGVVTNKSGNYSITAEIRQVLVFTYAGTLSREESVGKEGVINITLQENPASLENVVVVGYGTQRKVNLSGAVAQVRGKSWLTVRCLT